MDIMSAVRRMYTREIPDDPRIWHKRNMFWPVRCRDGRWAINVWRRQKADGAWEYSLREERDQEFWDRQW